MTDSLRIKGLRFSARHGVHPEERSLLQPFEVDIEIRRDLSRAAQTDRLEDTVDYPAVVRIVKEAVNGESCRLVERLAGIIMERLLPLVETGEIVVRIRKPRAPIETPFETVEVELRRQIT